MNNNISPILSVCIRSYNQETFIADALDSVLTQKTNFPFEIIISADCSTDSTPIILRKYQEQFSNKIRLILGETNIGGPNNLRRVIEASSAKYITCLDGDDFYTDEYKLQKQVCLFNRPDFHAVHDAHEFIRERWFVPIHSAVIRREYIEFPEWYNTVMNDDYVVHLSVVKNGPYYYMPDVMVAYRRHSENTSIAYRDLILTDTKLCAVLENMKPLYPAEYAPDFDARIAEYKAEIADLQLLRSQPWRKWLRLKTYKRIIKQWIKQNI